MGLFYGDENSDDGDSDGDDNGDEVRMVHETRMRRINGRR